MNLFKGAALVFAMSASAAARAQPLPIVGLGTQPCSVMFPSKNDPTAHFVYVAWALGFVTGVAISSQNGMLTGYCENGIELNLLLVCNQNPSILLATAAMKVATDLIRERGR